MSDTPASSRACPDCASPVRPTGQSFCDSCGAFLRWDAATGERPSGTTPPNHADRSDRAERPERADRDNRADRADREEAAAEPAAEEVTAPLPATTPSGEPSAAAPAPVPASEAEPAAEAGAGTGAEAAAAPDRPADRPADTLVRSLLVPVPENQEEQPPPVAAPVLPARPEAAAPPVRTVTAPAPVHDGTACPACARVNVTGRHFCRFCATPMVPERQTAADGPYAGQRPALLRDRRRWIARALVATGVVAVVVGGVFGGPPAARAVQDHFATRVAVHPISWAASNSAPKHAAPLAGDGYSNTWWGTGYAGDSAGQYLEARFGEPTDLLNVLITPGSSKNTTQADGQATPRTFDLVVTDASNEAHVSHHTINDGGTQRLDIRVRDAMTVRLVLRSAWRADPRRQVAVAELEFFGRSVS